MTYARGGLQIATILTAIVMARLVPPDEFGRAAVAIAVWQIGGVVGYEGFGASIVQRKTIDRRYLEAAAALALAGGLVLVVVVGAALYPLLSALIDQRTATLTLILCSAFLISSSSTVPRALLRRRLDFRQLALIEVSTTSTTIVAGLGLAFAGLDAEAIVLAALLASLTGTGFAFAVAPSVRPAPHREPLRELSGFALSVQASSILYAVQRYSSVGIVGATLGPSGAGFFQRAYSVGMEYQTKLTSIMLTIAFPLYSRMGDFERAKAMRRRVVRVQTTVLFPFLLLIAATAPVLVPWLYGERWTPAAEPTAILAIAGLTGAVLSGTGPIVLAAGRPDAQLRFHMVVSIVLPVVLIAGASLGLVEACLFFLGYQAVKLVAAQAYLLGRTCGIPFRDLFGDTVSAAVAGAVLFATARLVTSLLDGADQPAVLVLTAATLAGLAVYTVILRLAFPESWRDFYLIIDRVTGISGVGRRARRLAEQLR